MKLIIAGSRSIVSYNIVRNAIRASGFIATEIVSGRAKGVDRQGELYAQINGIPVHPFPALWAAYGLKAGTLRNHEMAEYADALIAVWDGESKGTEHMIATMRKLGKFVFVWQKCDVCKGTGERQTKIKGLCSEAPLPCEMCCFEGWIVG